MITKMSLVSIINELAVLDMKYSLKFYKDIFDFKEHFVTEYGKIELDKNMVLNLYKTK